MRRVYATSEGHIVHPNECETFELYMSQTREVLMRLSYAQADQNHRWAHISGDHFCHAAFF